MFRARDSCGADVRRGRSPKCLFIKATATGNTINGLNDEINKLPEAGHGRAPQGLRWLGRHRWAQPQACLQARSLPCPSHPACPPKPSLAPGPPPPHTPVLASSPLGDTRPRRSSSRHRTSHATLAGAVLSPSQGGQFWARLLPEPPQMCHVGAKLVVFGFGGGGGSQRPDAGL